MTLQIEDAVTEYRRQSRQDPETASWYLSFIRNHVRKIFRNMCVPWDQKAEDFLQNCIINYDVYSGQTFLSFCSEYMKHEYHLNGRTYQAEDSYLYSQGVQGNSFDTFNRNWTSTPERLTIDRIPGRRKEKGESE